MSEDPAAPKDAQPRDARGERGRASCAAARRSRRLRARRAARRTARVAAGHERRGVLVWNLDDYAFLDGEAPPTVNPGLGGGRSSAATPALFEVVDGIWQVARPRPVERDAFVRGATSWIVIDPLTSRRPRARRFRAGADAPR